MCSMLNEGLARIILRERVFYNSLARFSRSITIPLLVAEAKTRGRDLVVADVMAASGVRGIRYYLESKSIDLIVFNDRSRICRDVIRENININSIKRFEVHCLDANHFMYENRYRFDFIDIDPFGTPAPFIDAGISTLRNGGILAITATDLTALCGIYPKAGFRKYFSNIFKTFFCHEVALRVLISNLALSAGRHNLTIKPLLSIFTDQYARIHVKVYPGRRSFPFREIGFIIFGRESIDVVEFYGVKPGELGGEGILLGPLWIGDINDINVLEYILENDLVNYIYINEDRVRARNLLRVLINECGYPPFYYDIHKLSSIVKVSPPPIDMIIRRLRENGYRATRTHFSNYGVKSDCSFREFLSLLGGR